jgi:hypothetical protein
MGGETPDCVGGTPSVGKERIQPQPRIKRSLPLSRFDRNAPELALSEVFVFDHALTPQEKEENRRISSVRLRIEHVIGDIKRYRIIHDIIHFSCSEFRDMVMETCCGLHNFRIWLKRKKQSENHNKS